MAALASQELRVPSCRRVISLGSWASSRPGCAADRAYVTAQGTSTRCLSRHQALSTGLRGREPPQASAGSGAFPRSAGRSGMAAARTRTIEIRAPRGLHAHGHARIVRRAPIRRPAGAHAFRSSRTLRARPVAAAQVAHRPVRLARRLSRAGERPCRPAGARGWAEPRVRHRPLPAGHDDRHERTECGRSSRLDHPEHELRSHADSCCGHVDGDRRVRGEHRPPRPDDGGVRGSPDACAFGVSSRPGGDGVLRTRVRIWSLVVHALASGPTPVRDQLRPDVVLSRAGTGRAAS